MKPKRHWGTDPHMRHLMGRTWRKLRVEIIERDGGVCQECGAPGKEVHHRRMDAPNIDALENLVTLCPKCHRKYHPIPQGTPNRYNGLIGDQRPGALLKQKRIASGLTLADLAKTLGYSASALSSMENGRELLSSNVKRWCKDGVAEQRVRGKCKLREARGVYVTMETEDYLALREIADGRSVSSIVRQAVMEWLEKQGKGATK